MAIKFVDPNRLRKWTPEEVDEVIAFIKEQRPDVWDELEKIEFATGDFRGVIAWDIQAGLAMGFFNIQSLSDLSRLLLAIGQRRRASLGLKPGAQL